jgi:hypothetical protein
MWYTVINVLEESAASIFRIEFNLIEFNGHYHESPRSLISDPQCGGCSTQCLKFSILKTEVAHFAGNWQLPTRPNSITYHKTEMFVITSLRTSVHIA